jgi:hypothetical protein
VSGLVHGVQEAQRRGQAKALPIGVLLCQRLVARMPAVRKPKAWPPRGSANRLADVPQLKALLAPYPADDMTYWPVSARVGNVRNNDSSLIEPVAAA